MKINITSHLRNRK